MTPTEPTPGRVPGYLTTAQAADRLGVTRRRVHQIARTMEGVIRTGRDLLLPAAGVELYRVTRRPAGRPRGDSTR